MQFDYHSTCDLSEEILLPCVCVFGVEGSEFTIDQYVRIPVAALPFPVRVSKSQSFGDNVLRVVQAQNIHNMKRRVGVAATGLQEVPGFSIAVFPDVGVGKV